MYRSELDISDTFCNLLVDKSCISSRTLKDYLKHYEIVIEGTRSKVDSAYLKEFKKLYIEAMCLYMYAKGNPLVIEKYRSINKTSNTDREKLKTILKTRYSTSTDYCESILQTIRSRSNTRCPYCNTQYTRSGYKKPDIDHILPKSKFQEYSTFEPNLIECCNHCNDIKKEKYKNDRNECIFMHPYYQRNETIIECKLIIENGFIAGVNVEPIQKNIVLIWNHIETFELNKRYFEEIVPHFQNMIIMSCLGNENDFHLFEQVQNHSIYILNEHPNDIIGLMCRNLCTHPNRSEYIERIRNTYC